MSCCYYIVNYCDIRMLLDYLLCSLHCGWVADFEQTVVWNIFYTCLVFNCQFFNFTFPYMFGQCLLGIYWHIIFHSVPWLVHASCLSPLATMVINSGFCSHHRLQNWTEGGTQKKNNELFIHIETTDHKYIHSIVLVSSSRRTFGFHSLLCQNYPR